VFVENATSLTKATHGFTYSGIESQKISVPSQSEVQINSMHGLITDTTVLASGNSTVRLGNGNLSSSLVGTFAISCD
jgi:hypothetical protein